MDFLIKVLASFLDKFKAKNPMVFATVQAVIVAIFAAINQLESAGNLPEWEWLPTALYGLQTLLHILVGTRTYPFLPENGSVAKFNKLKSDK